jgi:8-oxo-dGTP diphosphatase
VSGSGQAQSIQRVALAVDVACFRVHEGRLTLLLIRRADPPFVGSWALPGGLVGTDESLDEAAHRVLDERTGVHSFYLEQLYTFGDPARDPRGRTVSVTYYALLGAGDYGEAPGRGSTELAWCSADELPDLAFDHAMIAGYARRRLAQKISYAPLAFRVLAEHFTMADLRAIHEAVLGQPLHPSNFVRQMLGRWDLAPVSGLRDHRSRRPARLYRYIGPPDIPGPPGAAPNGNPPS